MVYRLKLITYLLIEEKDERKYLDNHFSNYNSYKMSILYRENNSKERIKNLKDLSMKDTNIKKLYNRKIENKDLISTYKKIIFKEINQKYISKYDKYLVKTNMNYNDGFIYFKKEKILYSSIYTSCFNKCINMKRILNQIKKSMKTEYLFNKFGNELAKTKLLPDVLEFLNKEDIRNNNDLFEKNMKSNIKIIDKNDSFYIDCYYYSLFLNSYKYGKYPTLFQNLILSNFRYSNNNTSKILKILNKFDLDEYHITHIYELYYNWKNVKNKHKEEIIKKLNFMLIENNHNYQIINYLFKKNLFFQTVFNIFLNHNIKINLFWKISFNLNEIKDTRRQSNEDNEKEIPMIKSYYKCPQILFLSPDKIKQKHNKTGYTNTNKTGKLKSPLNESMDNSNINQKDDNINFFECSLFNIKIKILKENLSFEEMSLLYNLINDENNIKPKKEDNDNKKYFIKKILNTYNPNFDCSYIKQENNLTSSNIIELNILNSINELEEKDIIKENQNSILDLMDEKESFTKQENDNIEINKKLVESLENKIYNIFEEKNIINSIFLLDINKDIKILNNDNDFKIQYEFHISNIEMYYIKKQRLIKFLYEYDNIKFIDEFTKIGIKIDSFGIFAMRNKTISDNFIFFAVHINDLRKFEYFIIKFNLIQIEKYFQQRNSIGVKFQIETNDILLKSNDNLSNEKDGILKNKKIIETKMYNNEDLSFNGA